MKSRTKPKGPAKAPKNPSAGVGAVACWLICAAIVIILIARVRLLSAPLERDEGEYAYMGQLMLQGVPPYGVAANMKLPGTAAAYALIMSVFGQTPTGIHLGLLLVNVACIALIYGIAKKLLDPALPARHLSWPSLAAAAIYAVLSVGRGVFGLWAHATHFVVLAALGATLLIVMWSRRQQVGLLVGSGLLYGVAFLMKQPGLLFSLLGLYFLLSVHWPASRRRLAPDLVLFIASLALPFVVTCVVLWRAGVFDRFWFWVISYGRYYGSVLTISEGWRNFSFTFPILTENVWLIWLLAAAGATLAIVEKRASGKVLLALAVVSFAAVCPGLYFRGHYFVLMLPVVALLAASIAARPAVDSKRNSTVAPWLTRTVGLWLIVAVLAISIIGQKEYLFEHSPEGIVHTLYYGNPFVEAIEIAKYIESHSSRDTRIAILGSEPEILFYAHRRLVTPFIYIYPLVEKQPLAAQMQNEFIRDIERAAPEYVVIVNSDASWFIQAGVPRHIFEWWKPYEANYEQVGLADMLPSGTVYYWDADAAQTAPKSNIYVTLVKRKVTPPV